MTRRGQLKEKPLDTEKLERLGDPPMDQFDASSRKWFPDKNRDRCRIVADRDPSTDKRQLLSYNKMKLEEKVLKEARSKIFSRFLQLGASFHPGSFLHCGNCFLAEGHGGSANYSGYWWRSSVPQENNSVPSWGTIKYSSWIDGRGQCCNEETLSRTRLMYGDPPADGLLGRGRRGEVEGRGGEKKKQRQMRKAGQGSNGEDPDDEGETEDDDEDGDYWREQQEKLERERKAIMEDDVW
ncbi:hypothetical protein D4764_22G0007070 [Takifugu flavidus]|uniref:Uncharacterized protein n=1 Tax=Takifugu flavidus TaxID=433684 RepID=A0A5C6NGD4_9TELE|nr:hypothetical protein D4764_22G0007070 [Takifugu flavidus]